MMCDDSGPTAAHVRSISREARSWPEVERRDMNSDDCAAVYFFGDFGAFGGGGSPRSPTRSLLSAMSSIQATKPVGSAF
jgi:hypothetical protein